MGPSASQVVTDQNAAMAEVIKAMSVLQTLMKQPWAQAMFANTINVPSGVSDAMDGKPAPSAPTGASLPAAPPATPRVEEKRQPAEVAKVETPPPKKVAFTPDPPAETPDPNASAEVVNSSTHRAAHARLVRKMQSLNEAECPNMQKLWSGSRKDHFYIEACSLFSCL